MRYSNTILDALERINEKLGGKKDDAGTIVESLDQIADNIEEGGPAVVIDPTLTKKNQAAEAKTTGDRLTDLRAAVGSPLKASTASGMTDTDKIYVYTGSETGYTAGDWYYYDSVNEEWADGGVYNSVAVETDTTLTVSGGVADAKVTGDEITDLKGAFKENLIGKNNGTSFLGFITFAVGGFYNGKYTPNIKYRIASREDIVVSDYLTLFAKAGFKFNALTGSAGSYEDQSGWVTTYTLRPNTNYNISIRRATEDSSEVVTNISEFVTAVYYVLDSTLAIESNSNNIKKLVNGYIIPDWGFKRGNIVSSGFSPNNTYRVATTSPITLTKSTTIYIANGFKFRAIGSNSSWDTDWQTESATLLANTPFNAIIGRSPEDASEIITDITEFTNAISIPTSEKISSNSIINNNVSVPLLIKQALRPLNTSTVKPLVLFHFSDIHGDQTALERLVEFYEEYKTLFDDAICTGDLKAAYADNSMNFWNNVDGAENILISIGNHDATNRDSTLQSESAQYTDMFAPYIANWRVAYTTNKTYYYKDYTSSEVRLIVLNNMLSDAENDGQFAWFNSVLADAKSLGYTVLVATHYPNGWGDGYALNCNFTDIDATRYSAQFLRGSYQTALRDFRTNGGKFACYIGGHVHVDVMKTNGDIPNQVGVMIDACSISQSMPFSDINRNADDRTVDLANVFILDTSSNVVKVIRIGADRNRYLVSRKTICINYNTLEIISQS